MIVEARCTEDRSGHRSGALRRGELRHQRTAPDASLLTYGIPAAPDIPFFKTASIETVTDRNPLGAKGAGEAGAIGAPPAVVNAVVDALAPFGIRHLDMPLTPEQIWRALSRPRTDEP